MADCVNKTRSCNAYRSIDVSLLLPNAVWPFFSYNTNPSVQLLPSGFYYCD